MDEVGGTAGHMADTVTMLQDAAGSGHPVMYPGTLEGHASVEVPPVADIVVRPYRSDDSRLDSGKTTEGPVSRAIIRLIEWVIARLGGTPRH